MATLFELTAFLEARLALPDPREGDLNLLWRSGERNPEITRVGLALEYVPSMEAEAAKCDALFLHRPFHFPESALPGVPVLASHTGFDAHLTTGFNPALASALGLGEIQPVFRPDRPETIVPIGMIGTLAAPVPVGNLREQITVEFGGLENAIVLTDDAPVRVVAVMNALNPSLVALAAEKGATAYLTGQMRENARSAAGRSDLSVFAAGHERIEQWGLRRLAQEIRQAFPAVEALILQG
ncbi:MAG: Nif3-like dinuclear metal center hexameric protein [Armatimonadota bacterium]